MDPRSFARWMDAHGRGIILNGPGWTLEDRRIETGCTLERADEERGLRGLDSNSITDHGDTTSFEPIGPQGFRSSGWNGHFRRCRPKQPFRWVRLRSFSFVALANTV